METNEVITALACLLPVAIIGLAAAVSHRRSFAPALAPAIVPPVIHAPAIAPVAPVSNAPWQTRNYRELGDTLQELLAKKEGATQAPPGRIEAHRESPARPASIAADVIVPFLQSAISGLFGFGLAFSVSGNWQAGAVVGFIVALAMWGWRTFDSSRLLWLIEDVTHSDLDGDGQKGKPEPQKSYVQIEYTDKRGAMAFDDLPEPKPGALQRFAHAITLGTATFSEAGAGKYDYPREMWRRQKGDGKGKPKPPGLVDIFIAHGWAIDRGGKQGIGLTPDGESVITGLANQTPA